MLVFDLFAGTRSSTSAFEQAGHTVITFDSDKRFEVTEQRDVLQLTADYLLQTYGHPDFVWASPPCTSFSVASIGHHWFPNHTPKTVEAVMSMDLVKHTRKLVEDLAPRFGFVIENPRGKLRKLSLLSDLNRHTVTYCQYGDDRMKPTDLWTTVEGWTPRPICANGDGCHASAPRGSRTGTQGRDGPVSRSLVPFALGQEILDAIVSPATHPEKLF